ncbi:GNAT family N-acetyltransferase [Glaciecola siphonariae]|uniref:GNAT family N-acetyltransferase n=1 Tax=Glaciecola siphonariae TaxID=521012 RepID=A0ABV9LVI8_9ALTE
MSVTISKANSNDIPIIINLMQEHARYEKAEFLTENLHDRLVDELDCPDPRSLIFIARNKSMPAGYCALNREFSAWKCKEYMHMDCLYVTEQMRGRKIGLQLLNVAIQTATDQGLGELQWQTPLWNTKAIHFYQGLGASCSEKLRFTYNLSG